MKIYCEKCQSEEVEVTNTTKLPPEERVSIAEYHPRNNITTTLLYVPQTYVVRCKNCGNKREVGEGTVFNGKVSAMNMVGTSGNDTLNNS